MRKITWRTISRPQPTITAVRAPVRVARSGRRQTSVVAEPGLATFGAGAGAAAAGGGGTAAPAGGVGGVGGGGASVMRTR